MEKLDNLPNTVHIEKPKQLTAQQRLTRMKKAGGAQKVSGKRRQRDDSDGDSSGSDEEVNDDQEDDDDGIDESSTACGMCGKLLPEHNDSDGLDTWIECVSCKKIVHFSCTSMQLEAYNLRYQPPPGTDPKDFEVPDWTCKNCVRNSVRRRAQD